MCLMVIAATYHFGLGCGVGAGKLADFFHMIHIQTHVGVSESSVQELLKEIEALLPEFQKLCEQSATKKLRKVVVAMDETFFGKFMIMVVIDLQSGYLLLEDVADDRRKEMLGISEDIHPFSLNDNQIKPASQVENELENRAVKVAALAEKNGLDDPLTAKITEGELQSWVDRALWMVRHFHRSSSAVEGRNGCLSQMYHNGRGFTEDRLRALTVIPYTASNIAMLQQQQQQHVYSDKILKSRLHGF